MFSCSTNAKKTCNQYLFQVDHDFDIYIFDINAILFPLFLSVVDGVYILDRWHLSRTEKL